MLVISTAAFQILGVWLAVYISAAYASPLVEAMPAPRPDEGVVCHPASTWLRRECRPDSNSAGWQEVCTGKMTTDGYCLDSEVCQNIIDKDGDRSVRCTKTLPPNDVRLGKKQGDPKIIGSSPAFTAAASMIPTQFVWSVPISADLGRCSVAAIVLSGENNFVIIPVNILVGHKRYQTDPICQGTFSNSPYDRECYPLQLTPLKNGDFIDFTWGLWEGEEGTLQYTIFCPH